MKKDRKLRVVALVALCVSLFGLSVAYATLQASLSVSGTAVVKSGVWDVAITSIENVSTNNSYAQFTTAPSHNGTTASFAVDLKAPGDSATFDVVVSNRGSIKAKLDTFTLTGVDAASAAYVTYTVTPKDSVAVNSVLSAKNGETVSTHTYTVTVTYNENVTETPATDIQLSLGASIIYVQA